ncbi:MAG: DNA polymerase III subunit gamma/tau [Planctomycetales bacterium]
MSASEHNSTDYTVMARRFRPQGFAEVVGQEHVAQALKNAILGNRVAHAYLFTGARGVGKTSMARIFAKSLNCPNAVNGDPCNQCDMCQAIAAGSDVDVQEIDGASNRGIDDIRQLRANVNVRSMRSQYKVYIVDEVHMLTKEAFNALLKTLEEPPPSVKFVFCTTEPNKLPDTILSRCQRFDFGTIETNSIIGRLQQIADAEGRTVEPAALQLVARRAAGSMRDSQSLFDQVLAFGSEVVTPADVHHLLGTAPDERLLDLFDAILERDKPRALELFHGALKEGVQLGEFSDQILAYLRDLMVLAGGATELPLSSVADEYRPKLLKQAQNWGLRTAVNALQIFAEAKGKLQKITYGQVLIELALVRLTLLADLETLEAILQKLATGGVSLPTSSAPAPKSIAAAPPQNLLQKKSELTPVREPAGLEPQPAAPAIAEMNPRLELTADSATEVWSQVLEKIPGLLRDHARKASSVAISGPNQLVVNFPKGYDIQRNACEQGQSRLEPLIQQVTGKPVKFLFRTVDVSPAEKTALSETPAEPTEKKRSAAARKGEIPSDPLVQKALELFGGIVRTE